MKTHWKKLINPDYLGAYSLPEGKDMTVTIDTVKREVVKGVGGKSEECTIATIKGNKPLILNNTNCKMIQKIYDTPFIEEWNGKQITLYVSKISAFGEDNVECLRIRQVKPRLPELSPSHESWPNAMKSVQDNGTTRKQIESKYVINDENWKLLCGN